MGFGYLCSARRRGARKCSTKVLNLIKSASVPGSACPAGCIDIIMIILHKFYCML